MEKTVVTSTLFTLLNVHVESESVLTTIEYRRRKKPFANTAQTDVIIIYDTRFYNGRITKASSWNQLKSPMIQT